ncbi:ubiquinone/menaquinone biosynthesis C-methylase UbiE [Herbihabitans rhizosphaerae]|uniref:Ubiquinone/menaquinone biosynthesis C-methylase UbiE n=1 Tax=Herbihabitans rhizosphaerae TaxID=1872711 RepID=A0A4V2ETE2_9PSEU|nr:class I SAM-dependent methyltransferase [Herbihabitans rhizosphaerae]RZS40763.1 ubiquinone/menaquinone biosynthesis C-methylase UbiE [Herbihabitans rhizosphaerae]
MCSPGPVRAEDRRLPPGGRATLERMREVVLDYLDVTPRVIDLGCGTGWLTVWLHENFGSRYTTGVDVDPELIEAAGLRYADFEGVDFAGLSALDALPDTGADLIVRGGSVSPDGVYSSVAKVISGRDGLFVDLVYQYDIAPRPEPRAAAGRLRDYEQGGLVLRHWERHDSATDEPEALAEPDADRRHPAVAVLDTAGPLAKSAPRRDAKAGMPPTVDQVLVFAETWSAPIDRLPLIEIDAMSPVRRASYFGVPIPAPGGRSAVIEACQLLLELGASQDGMLLDVGCRDGHSSLIAAQYFPFTVGIDVQPAVIGAARRMAELTSSTANFSVEDPQNTEREAGSVEAALLTATLEIHADPQALLHELHRVLVDDGLVIEFLFDYGDPDAVSEQLRATVSPYFTPARLSDKIAMFERAGFELVYAERKEPPGISATRRDELTRALVDAELRRNPAITNADRDVLAGLVAEAVHPPDLDGGNPHMFLAAFRKARNQG